MNIDRLFLTNETSKGLYETVVKNAPIYDYHCHLSAEEIYWNRPFSCVTSMMLGADHYKWRAMRFAGVDETLVSGLGTSRERFLAWAGVCERLAGSPLQIWTAMELSRYFAVDEALDRHSADRIFDQCQQKLAEQPLRPSDLMAVSAVKLVCTTDDPADSLEFHQRIKQEQNSEVLVLPTFRPDRALGILKPDYRDYLEKLSQSTLDMINEGENKHNAIDSFEGLKKALVRCMDRFQVAGCRLSDHSLESMPSPADFETAPAKRIFEKRINGEAISIKEAEAFRWELLTFLAAEYARRDWVMQLHIGALRNINPSKFSELGPDSGFDVMNDFRIAEKTALLLGHLEQYTSLPKTILYTLNPEENPVLSVLPQCFGKAGIAGRVQFGAAWWFNDHKRGIRDHFEMLASQGMLADFVGMLTDSRSFLAYVRHDYFRRLLCQYLGELFESGEFMGSRETLSEIAEDISWKNIARYLGL